MKRVYLILTLFIASFFFISTNEVRAESFEYIIEDSRLDSINEKFYAVREYALNYVKENNGYYYIYCSNSFSSYYVVLMPGLYNVSVSYNDYIIGLKFASDLFNNVGKFYKYVDGEFQLLGSFKDILYEHQVNNHLVTYNYLDSNFDFFNTNTDIEVKISVKNLIYNVDSTNSLPSLYRIYLDSKDVEDEPVVDDNKYLEEKERISNFYTTIATKIGELATSFATNYIFLVIFGIFILIFVWELIRRWLL